MVGRTWTWDGETWTEEQPAESPGPRSDSVMVYDPMVERVLLFSGLQSEQPPRVWSWDGSTWTQTPIAPGPARATFASMASAPALEGSVLFGAGAGARDETWLLRVPPAAVGA